MTDIEWTDETWNPVVGCSVVSPGCTNCYAMRKAWRLGAMKATAHYRGLTKRVNGRIVWTGAMKLAPEALLMKPFRWKKPKRIFVNSMDDLFHEAIPDALIDRVFAIIALNPHHTFQILTKRAERMRDYIALMDASASRRAHLAEEVVKIDRAMPFENLRWPLANVWLGVSAEDQARAKERVPHLLATPAALHFVSAEPLLGAIDFAAWLFGPAREACGKRKARPQAPTATPSNRAGGLPATIDWIIAGGESGPNARPAHPDWFRDLRDQCAAAGIPFFFKQWGSWAPDDGEGGLVTLDRQLRAEEVQWAGDRFVRLEGPHAERPNGGAHLFRVGKKAAGHLLDGCEHREFPA